MHEVHITIAPEDLWDQTYLKEQAASSARIPLKKVVDFRVVRRSLDARYRPPVYVLKVQLSTDENLPPLKKELEDLPFVSDAREIHIIGAGPAGYFAAIECIKAGYRPIILERGKDVQNRRRDLRSIQQEGIVNPDSNYCFGEGGAGTYSDGKLYTRSTKRGNIESVLKILTECGADPDILVEAHPHIGSNKLPKIIANMRKVIEDHGGSIIFNNRVTGFFFNASATMLTGIEINHQERLNTQSVILATGHSARDIFQLLADHHITIEAKPFALGVRIEHPQTFIDQCQYGISDRGAVLPAASYALNAQYHDKGIFSFCMCPGGLIVPAATSPGEIVVNGMSLSRRDSPFANSGVVTSVDIKDLDQYAEHGELRGVAFQKSVEQTMFMAGNGSQAAPAQRLKDFISGNLSGDLPPTSYIPGVFPAPLHELLPAWIYERIKYGINGFDRKMPGYLHPEAIVLATESRTSSPVRIPRKPSGMHVSVGGLFPCGEGAGYAGGIVSAAMDGQFIAQCVASWLKEKYV